MPHTSSRWDADEMISIRDRMHRPSLWTWLMVEVALPTSAYECALSCAVPELDETALCGEYTHSYPVCRTASTWAEQDAHVALRLTGVNLPNASSTCLAQLVRVHCALEFQACDIAKSTKPLCAGECANVASGCGALFEGPNACEVLQPQSRGSSLSCFGLAYSGANEWLWVAGMSIAVLFSMLSTLGVNIQKCSMRWEEERGALGKKMRPSPLQPWWLLGYILLTAGAFVDFVAFGMAPQSLIAPIAALSLVWNIIMAPMMHDETATCSNLVATAVIFAGTTVSVLFGAREAPFYSLQDLLALFVEPAFKGYVAAYALFVLALFGYLRVLRRSEHQEPNIDALVGYDGTESREPDPGEKEGRGEETSEMTPSLAEHKADQLNVHEGFNQMIICYSGIAGCFGGSTVLLGKANVSLDDPRYTLAEERSQRLETDI